MSEMRCPTLRDASPLASIVALIAFSLSVLAVIGVIIIVPRRSGRFVAGPHSNR